MPIPIIVPILGLAAAIAAAIAAAAAAGKRPAPAPAPGAPPPGYAPAALPAPGVPVAPVPAAAPGAPAAAPPGYYPLPGIVPSPAEPAPAGTGPYPNLPTSVGSAIVNQLQNQKDPSKLKLLAAQARATASIVQPVNPAMAADYAKAAADLDARAAALSTQGVAPTDPIGQAANILDVLPPAVQAAVPGLLASVLPPGQSPAVPAPPPQVAPPAPKPPVPPPVPTVPPQPVPGVPVPPLPTVPPAMIPPPPLPVPPPGVLDVRTKYTVASGDWASAIATRFGVTLKQLAAANPQHKPKGDWNRIQVGEVFNLPPGSLDKGSRLHATGKAT